MTTLTFVESNDRYSTYKEADGTEVYLANGLFPLWLRRVVGLPDLAYLFEFDKDQMVEWWQDEQRNGTAERTSFLQRLRDKLTDPDIVDQVVWCTNCSDIDLLADTREVEGGERACVSCWEDAYRYCGYCTSYCTGEFSTAANGESYCDGCIEDHFTYCDGCDGYYADDSGHGHSDPGCCESPAIAFTIRNDGQPALANDTRVTVSLPAGTVDNEGILRIVQRLNSDRLFDAAASVYSLEDKWQTRDGNFTKRLSRLVYQKLAQKLPPDVISDIGNIAREHSKSVDFAVETTRLLNMSPHEFANGDSCWWEGYYSSRCALKTNGGFALRSFGGDYVSGRAWVMPLASDLYGGLTPTFNTEHPDAFVVFNGYGDLQGYTGARILSHMAGWTYRKVGFDCEPMYVNGNWAYLVAPEEIATKYTDGSLSLSVDQHSRLFQTESAAKSIDVRELANV